MALLDAMEEITHKICPFIAGGVLLGSIYWIAITYGAVTVMQVGFDFLVVLVLILCLVNILCLTIRVPYLKAPFQISHLVTLLCVKMECLGHRKA